MNCMYKKGDSSNSGAGSTTMAFCGCASSGTVPNAPAAAPAAAAADAVRNVLRFIAARFSQSRPRLRRLEADQRRLIFVGQQVQQPVGALPHVANPLMEVAHERLAPQLLPHVVEHDPLQLSARRDFSF